MEGRILKIREVGDPCLAKKCREVDINKIDDEILQLIADLKETLNFTEGFGIAAPQIGINKKIAIIKVEKERCKYKYCKEVSLTIMINPKWIPLSNETYEEFEGCLSVPSIRGIVKRYKNIQITYYNEKAQKITKRVSGFTARDIQHECDHLDGIVFLQKVTRQNGFATADMINKFNLIDNV